ncbi:MAG: Lysophospholipase 1 [Thelocarpon superellum]|nr:MAG: Lysophospholipase 1 [Thelocarpon superellum]
MAPSSPRRLLLAALVVASSQASWISDQEAQIGAFFNATEQKVEDVSNNVKTSIANAWTKLTNATEAERDYIRNLSQSVATVTTNDVNAWKGNISSVLHNVESMDFADERYKPIVVDCPATRPTIRDGSGLSPNEEAWLKIRRPNTVQPMRDFLTRVFNDTTYPDVAADFDRISGNFSLLPNIGITASGGGYRAMLNGAGGIKAFDNRTAVEGPGSLGGLLQASTYLAGLSGGSWLVGSIYVNNFTDINSLQTKKEVWELSQDIFQGPPKTDPFSYWVDIFQSFYAKKEAGFETSVTDTWARALSWQFVDAPDGGPSLTWSSIADQPGFVSGEMPMPLVVADGRAPDEYIVSINSTVFEFNPWEMGSFDPTLAAFAPLKYLGSNFSGGVLPSDAECYNNFDNAGFVFGTSSALFNAILPRAVSWPYLPPLIRLLVVEYLTELNLTFQDVADYTPNPFFGYKSSTNPTAGTERLTLCDGGEDGENVPYHPLIQEARAVDVILSTDSSSDVNSWPTGDALYQTYLRSQEHGVGEKIWFPKIPDNNTIVNLELNNRPTIFGCDEESPVPLLVWMPNAPYSYMSNVSTFDLRYSDAQRDQIIQNGYDVVTQGNISYDWPMCVGCAILKRSSQKQGTKLPEACTGCFETYCYNNTIDDTPAPTYDPSLKLKMASLSDSTS